MNTDEEAAKVAGGYEENKNEILENNVAEGENLDTLFNTSRDKYPGRDLIIGRKNPGKFIIKPGTFIDNSKT